MSSFGERLKKARKSKGFRQVDLAKKLDLAQTTIANYEQNVRFPNEEILIKFADYLDVSLDYLLGRGDEPIDAKSSTFKKSHLANSFIEIPSIPYFKESYINALLSKDKALATELVFNGLQQRISLEELYTQVFEPALIEIGELWEKGTIHVGQEHYVAEITQLLMAQMQPYLTTSQPKHHRMVAMCVHGEYHSIGIKMLVDLFEKNGWNTYYLGVNVPTQSVIKTIEEVDANLLAISATMPSHVNSVENTIEAIRHNDPYGKVKIMVGGNAFNHDKHLWKKIGADAYSNNAVEAVKVANDLFS